VDADDDEYDPGEGDDFLFGYDEGEDSNIIGNIGSPPDFREPDVRDLWQPAVISEASHGRNGPFVIMQLYSQVCDQMRKLVTESTVDFLCDPLYRPGSLSHFSVSMHSIKTMMEYALIVDSKAEEEYRLFQQHWSEKRAVAANVVTELFEKADKLQAKYDSKYQKAEEVFSFRFIYFFAGIY
jgi:hypothetical protein